MAVLGLPGSTILGGISVFGSEISEPGPVIETLDDGTVLVNWSLLMAFVVETGVGIEAATSYIAVADARTYVEETHGCEDPLLLESTRSVESLLRQATRWLDGSYRKLYRGERKDDVQGLEWPRLHVEVAFPAVDLGQAQVEVARRFLDGTLRMDADLDPDRGSQRVKSEKVGPIAVTYAYGDDEPGPGQITPYLPQVERILGRWISGSLRPGSSRVVPWVRG